MCAFMEFSRFRVYFFSHVIGGETIDVYLDVSYSTSEGKVLRHFGRVGASS